MEGKGNNKKGGLVTKTWKRCKSIAGVSDLKKSASWPKAKAKDGCFSVYVGPKRQRFVIKTSYANHPLFKMLLEEAESEYGYSSHGPLLLPCHVDVFYNLLMQMQLDFDSHHPTCPCLTPPLRTSPTSDSIVYM